MHYQTWFHELLRQKKRQITQKTQPQPEPAQPEPKTDPQPVATFVENLSQIPQDCPADKLWELDVTIESIVEMRQVTGQRYYFLNCLDNDALPFPVICWIGRWAKYRGFKAGQAYTIRISAPPGRHEAFTLR